jgi:pSer/pThr/pTyr-binding forkhead associated (FHA) protein
MIQLLLLPDGDRDDCGVVVDHFPFVLGRHSRCDCALDDPLVSRQHCRFFLLDNQLWVQDLGSLNGSYVNGEPLSEPQPIHDGDQLRLGSWTFWVAVCSLENTRTRVLNSGNLRHPSQWDDQS